MAGGKSENPSHHLTDDAQFQGNANSKKQKLVGNSQDTLNRGESSGATTHTAIINANGTSGTNLQQKPLYNPKMGLTAMEETQQRPPIPTSTVEDESMDNEWFEVQRTRERYFAATVRRDYVFGENKELKKQELKQLLIRHRIHCTEGPTEAKSTYGEAIFRIAVETQEDLDNLLSLTIDEEDEENGTASNYPMFKRQDNTRHTSEQERSIEIYGLHPRTPEFRILSAMAQFGDVEKVTTRPCKRGFKIIAKVVFKRKEDVAKVQKSGRKWVFVGRDLARLSTVGAEKVSWELNFIAKLSNLPFGTTTLDLQPLLGENKAEFIIIPKIYSREGKFVQNQREAFVYFANLADMESNMETPVRISGHTTKWGDKEEKR
ncbi:hypothetical protein BGX27_005039, partial [Mortierella sp. AM989]